MKNLRYNKYLSVFITLFLVICAVPILGGAVSLPINNLAIINRIYRIVSDAECQQTQNSDKRINISEQNERDSFGDKQEIPENEKNDKQEKSYVALTFDDGPHPEYTGKILNILSEKNAPATFFIVGDRAELHPTLLRRIKQANCEIGNHTYSHVDLSKINNTEFMHQMEKCNEAIFNATGEYPKIYRPPFGRISSKNEKSISDKMTKILWTVDSEDWTTPDKDRVADKVINSVKNKSIVLMHDFYKQSAEALPRIIDTLREKGYEFVTVSQLKELSALPDRMEYFIN